MRLVATLLVDEAFEGATLSWLKDADLLAGRTS